MRNPWPALWILLAGPLWGLPGPDRVPPRGPFSPAPPCCSAAAGREAAHPGTTLPKEKRIDEKLVREHTHLADGRPDTVKDAAGRTTTFHYDPATLDVSQLEVGPMGVGEALRVHPGSAGSNDLGEPPKWVAGSAMDGTSRPTQDRSQR